MKTFFKYHWYSVKNFFASLSFTEFIIFSLAACFAIIIGLSLLVGSVKLFLPFITFHIQTIEQVFPLVICFAVLLSRLFIQSEKTLKRICTSHDYYITLPLKRNSILQWSLIMNFLRDSIWCILGIVLTIIIAYLGPFRWGQYFSQTIPLIVLWVMVGGLISYSSFILRMILTNHIQFEHKFVRMLLTYAEIIFSVVVLVLILGFRYILMTQLKVVRMENNGLVAVFFPLATILLLYLVIRKLFSKYETEIKKYVEIENDYYSMKELPVAIDELIKKYGSPLTQNILRLTLATRSYGFTKFYSLIVISAQAIILLLFSLNIPDPSTSVIVFIIAAALSLVMSFSMILTPLPFLFTITRSLPVSFRDITRSFLQGGFMLSIPVFILVLLLCVFLGLGSGMTALSISLLSSVAVVLMRMFIAFQYPYSKLMSDLIYFVNLIIIVLFFPLMLLVLYHYNKAHQVWNTNRLL